MVNTHMRDIYLDSGPRYYNMFIIHIDDIKLCGYKDNLYTNEAYWMNCRGNNVNMYDSGKYTIKSIKNRKIFEICDYRGRFEIEVSKFGRYGVWYGWKHSVLYGRTREFILLHHFQ